jgi:O-methyltransferase involved in polyketide biosynthesis
MSDTSSLPFDTSVAHPARVYDVWLGGKDNFAPDREAARRVMEHNRAIVPGVRANRAFLARVVRHLVADEGVDQFLDLGTGLPSASNVHEVAQAADPQARIVYVDNDPIVLAHAQALLTGTPGTVSYVDADIRDAGAVLREAGRTLDLSRPVAVLLLMTLQFLPDEVAHELVRRLMASVPAGSFLAVSHPASDVSEQANQGTRTYNELVSTGMTRRSRQELLRFYDGLELAEPGLVPIPFWRPDPGDQLPALAVPAYAVLGRKV